MKETANLSPPSVLKEIETETEAIGFTMASDHQTGALLRTLATAKPGGKFLEIGTGTGVSAAWILDGMDAGASLTTVDINLEHAAIAKRHLGSDPRITFKLADGADYVDSLLKQGEGIDFIFADSWPGKFAHLEQTLQLLNPGGIYVIDDLLPQPSWPDDHARRVPKLIARLEQMDQLNLIRLDWSTGLIVATKKASDSSNSAP